MHVQHLICEAPSSHPTSAFCFSRSLRHLSSRCLSSSWQLHGPLSMRVRIVSSASCTSFRFASLYRRYSLLAAPACSRKEIKAPLALHTSALVFCQDTVNRNCWFTALVAVLCNAACNEANEAFNACKRSPGHASTSCPCQLSATYSLNFGSCNLVQVPRLFFSALGRALVHWKTAMRGCLQDASDLCCYVSNFLAFRRLIFISSNFFLVASSRCYQTLQVVTHEEANSETQQCWPSWNC